MSFPFSRHRGLIVVDVALEGPAGSTNVRMALDTGATDTLIDMRFLIAVGYDPAAASQYYQVTTGSGVVSVPSFAVSRLTALGQTRTGFPILAHTLPPSASVDGVLGLDFLRGQELTINFRTGMIDLR
jgi:hypothetical protein